MTWMIILMFVGGLVALLVGAEWLVRGASHLAFAAGISRLVVGLTVVAYGTSAPEMAVTIQSTLAGEADLAIGNVVGSNISNILLVLGISATIAPLSVSRQLVRSSVPIMIGFSIVLAVIGWDGQLSRFDGLLLISGAIGYTVFALYESRLEMRKHHVPDALVETGVESEAEAQKERHGKRLLWQVGWILLGLGSLILGARLLVTAAIDTARLLQIPELVIGLTIVAIGTSLPEIATTVIAGFRGERDIAVGNAVGSNIFNIALVLGVGGLMAPAGVDVSAAVRHFDLPVMIAVSIACLPIFFTGLRISRGEGLLFLTYFIAYTSYLFLKSTEHDALEPFSRVMLWFVIPLTSITLVLLTLRAWMRKPETVDN